jgi:hypothetical protein
MSDLIWKRTDDGFYTCYAPVARIERFTPPINAHFSLWDMYIRDKRLGHTDTLRTAKEIIERKLDDD